METISLTPFLLPAFVSLVFMLGVFITSLGKKDNSIADIAWGMGFIIISFTALVQHSIRSPIQYLVMTLVTLWGCRLAFHIHMRNRGRSEDFRYQKWREEWGKNVFWKSFFQVYVLQWVFMQLIATGIVIIMTYAQPQWNPLVIIGISIWIVGFFFETIGDYQLLVFKRLPESKGKIMNTGLWHYTRHPNYFGEVTQWWGIFCIALSVPNGAWAIISPVTITFLILKVSGIPLLEKKYEGNAEFEAYKRKTSAFFPWIPKKS